MYQRYGSSKAARLKAVRCVSAQTLAFSSDVVIVFVIGYRLAIFLEAYARCHLQASRTCTCISSLSFFYSYRFLGRQCIGSVKVQAKLKWNARVVILSHIYIYIHIHTCIIYIIYICDMETIFMPKLFCA